MQLSSLKKNRDKLQNNYGANMDVMRCVDAEENAVPEVYI